MDTLSTVKQAWKLLWTNKYFWFFGLFVAGTGSGGGNAGQHPDHGAGAAGAGSFPTWLWPVLIVAGLAGIAALVMHVVSEAAMIEGIQRRKADESYGIKAGLRGGLQHFWRVLKVKLFAAAVVVGVGALVAIPVLFAVFKILPMWIGIPIGVLVALVAVPALITGYLAYEYALRFAVLDGAPATDAFRAALGFLHGRLVPSILLLVTSSASSIVAGLACLVAAIPGAVLGAIVYFAAGLVPAIVAGCVLFVPLLFPIIGALGSFRSAIWTIGFLDARRLAA